MSDDDAIPAATLILVRERPSGPPQLLMVERAAGMTFAGGAMVFPGGRIDEADRGFGDDAAAKVAAIRETLEEVAIPVAIEPLPTREQSLQLQRLLIADRPLDDVIDADSLRLDALTPDRKSVV